MTSSPRSRPGVPPRVSRLWAELRRRRVPRAAALYGVVGWGVVEVATATFPYLGIPDWGATLVIVLVLLGLPLALVLAWAFDLTAHGIRPATPPPGDPARSGSDAVDAAPGDDSGSPAPSPSSASAVSPARNRTAMALLVVAVLAAVAFGGLRLWQAPSAAASADVVAVFPFAVRGGTELDYLGDGMVSLLATKLDGAGSLRSVDPRALLSRLAEEGSPGSDPEAAARTAGRLGAGRMVLGDVLAGGDRIRVNASLYEVGGGTPRKVVDGTAEGPAEAVFALVDEVAAQLLADAVGPSARVRRIAAVTTSSLPAFRSYVEGDLALREGRFAEAVEALERAVELDSLFALAWYRLSLATEYRGLAHDAQDAARRALENAGRLSERDRRLLEAFVAWRSGDSHTAERLYRAHVSTYPDDVEAWFELGEVLFHLNPLRGRSFLESEDAFRRVLSLEPGHAGSLIHMIRISYAQRDLPAMDTLLAVLEREEGGDRTLENQALQAFAHGDPARIERVLARLGEAGDGDIAFALWVVGTYGANLDGAVAITDIMVRPQGSPELRALGHTARAFFAAGRGRWTEAARELAAVAPLDPGMALENEAWLALLPIAPTGPEDLFRIRDRLAAMDSATLDHTAATRNSLFSGLNGQHRVVREYLLGLTTASLGDAVAADSFATRVLRYRDAVPNPALLDDYARSIRARLLLRRGRPAEAMTLLEQLNLAGAYPLFWSPFHHFALERFTIAETLLALGRGEEALERYTNLVGTSSLELVLLNPARLRRAEILEDMGRRDEAAELYRRFLDAWTDPDPELAYLREEARLGLARLTGASTPGAAGSNGSAAAAGSGR